MASGEAKKLVRYLQQLGICKNLLLFRTLEENFRAFLTDVKVPSGFADDDYKLEPHHETYKFRRKLVKEFIDVKKSKDFRLTENSHSKQFFDELEQFVELPETEGSFSDFDLEQTGRLQKIDLFEENVKVKGVVVCKFSKKAKVCVLIKTKDPCRGLTGSFSLSEVFVDLREEDDTDHEGFHLKLAVGDIVEVTKCRRKEGTALEPDIVRCYSLSDTQIESFLIHLSNSAQERGSSATMIEITRFSAAWEYILNLSKEEYSEKMILQILEIINKIATVVPMSLTASAMVQGFQQSVLFGSVLPGFINVVTGRPSHVSMVQQILEHVITAVPASGLQVLPMAKVLAQNLVQGSCSSECEAKESGLTATELLSKLCSIIASEVPGAKKDLDKLPWKELSLIPVTEEIFRPSLKTSDLPVIRVKGNYKSEEDYLNTYFRLLREECFYKLRKGISEFVEYGETSGSKDLTMYRVSLRGCSTRHENSPTVMLISLDYELPDSQDGLESEQAEWLMYGNLLCISLDGSFEEPVWAVVERHIASERIVGITLCEKGNTLSEPQFIAKMQELKNKKSRAFMAESQTCYVSYAPAMEILQQRDYVPFKEFLVYPDSRQQVDPPEYIDKIKHPPDWEIIYKKEALAKFSREDVSPSNYSLTKDFEDLRLNISSSEAKPDETQLAAIAMALKHRVILIQGPPGTGKSFVGVTLVRLLLSMNVPQDHGPILVVTYKNHALDNFLKECLRKGSSPDVRIVRVGRWNEDAGDELKKCLLRERVQQDVNRKPGLYNQKRKVLGQIWALQPKVTEAFEKLRTSSRFSADMFLKEASEEQLKSLVVDSKQGRITEEELEELISKQSISRNQAKLNELVENALLDWLPGQKLFDRFSGEKKKAAQGNRPAESDQQKRKEDQDQQENPNDARDPSVEQRERLLALDEEIADEEDQSIAKEEESSSKSQAPLSVQCLRSLVCLDDAELRPYEDILNESKIWELEEHRRVQFVYVLQSKYFSKASSEFKNVSRAYLQLHHQLKEVRNQQDIEVMKRCHVIGMTVTGATMRANLLADIKPSVVIVEEAAEILEGQLVAVIPPSVQHLIMIGDHKQLKPMVHYHRLKKHHHLDLSMFERLWNCRLPCKQLGFQCRVRDEFVDLLRELKIYDNLQTHKQLVENNVRPACVESSMYFWTHTKWESEASHSKRNSGEAEEITRVAKFFCQEGEVHPSKITVLCSYRGQVKEIESHFRSTEITALEDIKVTTIDSFQGQENDIILVSLVRSNKEGVIGYLASMDRLCVAISRARCGLYLFGNHAHLSRKSRKGWKIVSDFMRKRKQLGCRFPFRSSVDSESLKPAQTSFGGESPGVSKEESIEGIFTSEGGVMAGGNIRLVCPPGALDDSLSVTITLEDPSKYYSLIVQKDLENDVIIAAPIVNLQPNGHSFRKPIKLTTSFKNVDWKWHGDDVFILHGTEARDGKVTWQNITKSSKIDEAAGEVEVELKHFSLIMVLLRWTLIRGKDILSRFDLLSFDYTLLVLLNKTSPSSAHDMLALLFVSQDVYHEQFYREDETSALVQLTKEGFMEVHEHATDRLDEKRIYNHENLQVSIQLGKDYKLADSQHRSFSFSVDSSVWWNGGKVIKLPLEWRNEVRYLCGTISVNGENGHAIKKHFSEGDLCNYVRKLLGMEGNIFNVVTIARLLEMPEEVLNQVTKSWEDDGGQLNLTLQHWSEKTGGVENLSSVRKCLKDINQEEYRVSPRGKMHIRRLRKLATKITDLQHNNTDLVRNFSRNATILCNSVLRDCCLELNQDEAFSSSNDADSFVKQFIENRQPMLEDISTKYKLVCSPSDESRTSIFLAIVPHLIQTIKEIFVDHKKLVPHSGLTGLHEENVDQFLTSVLNARQSNRFRDLVYVECQILEKLCMKNHSKKPVAEITKWSKSLAIEQMLNFLEQFFKHCLHDIRLHKRLELFSCSLRDTLLTDDKEVDEDYRQDFANVLLSLVDFAKFHPSKLVRFQLVDSKSSTLSSTSSDVENLVHNEYDDTYSQTFSIKKVSEDELQLGAAACVHIDGSICKKGAFQSVIMLNRSGMDAFNRCTSRFAPADIAVVKMAAENKHSGNLQIVLYASQKEKLSDLIQIFKQELSEDMVDLRQSEVSQCYLLMRCIDFTKEKVLRLRLEYKWGSEAVALDSKHFVTFADCSAGGACLPKVTSFDGLDNSLMTEDLEALSLTSGCWKFPLTSFDQLQKHGSAQSGKIEYHLHQTFNQVTGSHTCVIGNQATVNDQMPSQRALPEGLNYSPKRSITEGRRSLPEAEDSKDRS